MLIKSLSVKSIGGIKALVTYIMDSEKRYKDDHDKEFLYAYNLLDKDDPEYYTKAFKENISSIAHLPHRNKIMHFIISAHPEDSEKINSKVMRRIARKFIGLVNPKGMYLACGHAAKNKHFHIIASGLEVDQKRSISMNKKQFSAIQQEMQLYIQQEFNLTHSFINYGHKERVQDEKPQTVFQQRKQKRTSLKQQIKNQTQEIYTQSQTLPIFIKKLQEQSIDVYSRSGIITGIKIQTGRKYRFATIGLKDISERWPEIKTIRAEKEISHRLALLKELKDIRNEIKEHERGTERDDL